MKKNKTISWIFLATALASKQNPASLDSILQMADAINHTLPSFKQLKKSLKWLMNFGLVENTGEKYKLTNNGKKVIDQTESRTNNVLFNILDELTKEIIKLKT